MHGPRPPRDGGTLLRAENAAELAAEQGAEQLLERLVARRGREADLLAPLGEVRGDVGFQRLEAVQARARRARAAELRQLVAREVDRRDDASQEVVAAADVQGDVQRGRDRAQLVELRRRRLLATGRRELREAVRIRGAAELPGLRPVELRAGGDAALERLVELLPDG